MSGPTTTGSIDAKLTLDDSDFKRGMAEAKAEAREVGSLEPTVKVDANVGPALAKLEAVAAAERNLDLAYQRSAISQEKLDQVTKKYGEDSVQAAAARLTHSRAIGSESDAEGKLTRAQQLGTVEADKNTAATQRNTQANQQRTSVLQVALGLAPALLGAAAPIAAAAVGLGVAFGVMGVSGVLAIKGIKDEMASGSAVGNQYASGLGELKVDLNQLSQTSAVAMLGSFNGAVGDISNRMPFLNQLVGDGASLLGAMGGTALNGVLNGLQQMNPLIQQGGVELGKFVTWLFSFTGTNGFSEFISYASANLPAVMHLIESLVTLSGRLLAAFAPLGPVIIGVLSAISDTLSNMPLPVLAGLVTAAAAAGPAFRIAGAGVALFGIEANLAVPVVGILLAALAGIGMMAATAALGTDKGTASLTNYTQALRDDNQLLGEHVRLQAAKALSDAGAFDAARELGISQKTLTDDLMGVAGAHEVVTAAIKRGKEFQNDWSQGIVDSNSGIYVATAAQDKMGKSIETVTKTLEGQKGALSESEKKNRDQAAAMDQTTGAAGAQTSAVQAQASAYGVSVGMYQSATAAQQAAALQLAQTTANMVQQNDAAGLLKQAMDALNGKSLSLEQAQTRAAGATNTVTAAFVQNGIAIDGGSAAAVANQTALQGKVQADQAAAEAVGKATGSTEAGTKAYADSKAQLERTMSAQGLLTDEVQGYINKLYDVNNFKPVLTKLDVDTAAGIANIESFKAHLASVQDRVVTVTEQTIRDPGGMGSSIGGRANGSLAGGQASGGLVPEHWATGGFPGRASGTDTVPTWLTPGEHVMRRSSVQSIGPAALNYMNDTGKIPGQGSQATAGPMHLTGTLVLDSGEMLGTFRGIVQEGIDGVARQVNGMRR